MFGINFDICWRFVFVIVFAEERERYRKIGKDESKEGTDKEE